MFRGVRKQPVSFVMPACLSVCPFTWNNSAPTGRIFMKFDIQAFFQNLSRKFTFHWNLTRITGSLYEAIRTFMTRSGWTLLTMRNASNKNCAANQNTFLYIYNCFLKIVPFIRWSGKIRYNRKVHRWQYGACALRAGYLRLQTHTQNMWYLLIFKGNNAWANAPQYHVIRTLPASLNDKLKRITASELWRHRSFMSSFNWRFCGNPRGLLSSRRTVEPKTPSATTRCVQEQQLLVSWCDTLQLAVCLWWRDWIGTEGRKDIFWWKLAQGLLTSCRFVSLTVLCITWQYLAAV